MSHRFNESMELAMFPRFWSNPIACHRRRRLSFAVPDPSSVSTLLSGVQQVQVLQADQ